MKPAFHTSHNLDFSVSQPCVHTLMHIGSTCSFITIAFSYILFKLYRALQHYNIVLTEVIKEHHCYCPYDVTVSCHLCCPMHFGYNQWARLNVLQCLPGIHEHILMEHLLMQLLIS